MCREGCRVRRHFTRITQLVRNINFCSISGYSFTVLCAVISSLYKEVLIDREGDLVTFWNKCVPKDLWSDKKANGNTLEVANEFKWRSICLQSMTLFLQKTSLSEQTIRPILSIVHAALESCKGSFNTSGGANLLLLRILQLFESFKDPSTFQPSFTTLLSFSNKLITLASPPCTHALRKLLESEDALLGPLAPGGDALQVCPLPNATRLSL